MALGRGDPVEAVARVATARRDRLLRVNRRRLRWEDLEDCYSQATLELVARAQRDPFASPEHILHALEQKFSSRIDDRRRAIGGRSPIEMAIAQAVPVDAPESGAGELEDPTAEVMRQVAGRLEVRRLRELASELTDDQRLVLACQVSLDMDCAEFCRRFGWSSEKFRKVAQRARSRLRALVSEYQVGERCRRLEPDLLAYSARAATPDQAERATAHLANCTACAGHLRALDRASRQVAALIPSPIAAHAGVLAKLGGLTLAARRIFGSLGRGATEAGAAGVAGGSAVGAGAVKLGVAAACLAGAAGGYAICAHGIAAPHPKPHHRVHASLPRKAVVLARTASVVPVTPTRTQTPARPIATRPAQPVRGVAAAAVAHREFGVDPAHAASAPPLLPAGGSGSGSGGSATGSGGTVGYGASGASGGSASSGGAPSGVTPRDASQARREFSSFER